MSSEKSTFFKQSGWMIIATNLGGLFMVVVHSVAIKMGPEYSLFVALLGLFIVLGVPAIGLQTVFAQQAAAAVTEEKKLALNAMTRALVKGTLIFWIICGVIVLTASK